MGWMKLPRWLVIAMLTSSALAVLAAAGWWWVTWPERTAREFVELLKAHRADEALRMIPADSKFDDRNSRWWFAGEGDPSTFQSRTWLECIAGCCQFDLETLREIEPGWTSSLVRERRFIAKRGHIEYADF